MKYTPRNLVIRRHRGRVDLVNVPRQDVSIRFVGMRDENAEPQRGAAFLEAPTYHLEIPLEFVESINRVVYADSRPAMSISPKEYRILSQLEGVTYSSLRRLYVALALEHQASSEK